MAENDIENKVPDSYEVQMSDSAMRKTDLMIAMGEHDEHVYDSDIEGSYLENDDRQGDVARAMAECEHDSINTEVNNSMGLGE